MHVYQAELTDINDCHQFDLSYTTDYVWQMQTREQGRTIYVSFDTVRLPRPMQVEYPRPADELATHWQQHDCFLVAKNSMGNSVGFLDAQAQLFQERLWIFNLAVNRSERQRGVGTVLLKSAHRWALQQGIHQIMLEIQTKNHPAISFAQKHGFQFCGYNELYYPNGDIALFFSRNI